MYMKYLVRVTSTTVIKWLLLIVTFFYHHIFIFCGWVSSIVPQQYRLLTGSTTGFYKQQRSCTINSNPVTGPQCTFSLVTVALWIQCSIFSICTYSCVLGNQCNVCWSLTFWSTNLVLLPVSVSTRLCSRCLCSFSSSESSPSLWWISRCLLEYLINMCTLSFYKTDKILTMILTPYLY